MKLNPGLFLTQKLAGHDYVKTRFQGKSILCKKTPQNRLFGGHESGLPDFGRPLTATVDTGPTSGLSLKTWGYDDSN